MRRFTFVFLVVGAMLLGALLFLSRRTESRNSQAISNSHDSRHPAGEAASTGTGLASVAQHKSSVSPRNLEAPSSDQSKPVRVQATQIFASVNGVSITGKDLMPLPAGDPQVERSMSREMYEFLLDQAIDRELTFQAARAQRIELTDSQRRHLEQLRRTMERRHDVDPLLVVNLELSGTVEDQIAFRTREATATLLMASLLGRAGAPSPIVSPNQIQEYYNNHVDRYGPLPSNPMERQEAWDQIQFQIRLDLALPATEQYSQQRRDYLQELKLAAHIARSQHDSGRPE